MNLNNVDVVAILKYGFLGLSLLIIILCVMLIKEVLSQENANPEKIELIKFFFKTSLIFMITAAPLQWINEIVVKYTSNKQINLAIQANNRGWEKEFGEIFIQKNNKQNVISGKDTGLFKGIFHENEEIIIDVSDVLKSISGMRQQIMSTKESCRQQNSEPEYKTTIGDI